MHCTSAHPGRRTRPPQSCSPALRAIAHTPGPRALELYMLCLMRGRHRAFVSSRGRWTSTGRRAKRELFGAGDQAPGARRRDSRLPVGGLERQMHQRRGRPWTGARRALSAAICLSVPVYPLSVYPGSRILYPEDARRPAARAGVLAFAKRRGVGVVLQAAARTCTAPAYVDVVPA